MKTNAKQLAAARRAMEVIAVHEGISVEEVRREISLAILKQKSKGERKYTSLSRKNLNGCLPKRYAYSQRNHDWIP